MAQVDVFRAFSPQNLNKARQMTSYPWPMCRQADDCTNFLLTGREMIQEFDIEFRKITGQKGRENWRSRPINRHGHRVRRPVAPSSC